MFKNQKHKAVFLIILLLAIIGFTGAILKINRASANSVTSGFTQPDLTNIDLEKSEEQIEANGVTLRLINAFQNGDYFQVNLCYTLPDDRDWLLADKGNEVFLNVKEKLIYPFEEGTIDWIFTDDGIRSERCEYLLFPVVVDKDVTYLTLTVTQLSVSQPEILDCPAIQKQLNDANSDLTIECYSGDGSSGIKIIEKPADMTELDARELMHKLMIDAQSGPWEFNIQVPNP